MLLELGSRSASYVKSINIKGYCLQHSLAKGRIKVLNGNFTPNQDKKIDEEVYLWFVKQRPKNTPVSGPLIREIIKLSLFPFSMIQRHFRNKLYNNDQTISVSFI